MSIVLAMGILALLWPQMPAGVSTDVRWIITAVIIAGGLAGMKGD